MSAPEPVPGEEADAEAAEPENTDIHQPGRVLIIQDCFRVIL